MADLEFSVRASSAFPRYWCHTCEIWTRWFVLGDYFYCDLCGDAILCDDCGAEWTDAHVCGER